MRKCIECNSELGDFKPGEKPFCNTECEKKFNAVELKLEFGFRNNRNCMNCNEPLEFEPEYCCDGRECDCRGLPIEPPFCTDECHDEWCKKCGNCEGEGWVMIDDNGLPNRDKCQKCNGSGKLWNEPCVKCGSPVKVNMDYDNITCDKCHDKFAG